jgi:hypothetical protein
MLLLDLVASNGVLPVAPFGVDHDIITPDLPQPPFKLVANALYPTSNLLLPDLPQPPFK